MLRRWIAKRSTVDQLIKLTGSRESEVQRLKLAAEESSARLLEATRKAQKQEARLEDADTVLKALRGRIEEAHAERENLRQDLASARAQIKTYENFNGHYFDWRMKRQLVIVDRFGADWFRGKRILELACGYGDIGAFFMSLGADVIFSEARQEHLDVIRSRYPSIPTSNLMQWDAEQGIPEGEFDLIIHMGLLYHLDSWKASIHGCRGRTKTLVIETEVMDSDGPTDELKVSEAGADQSFIGTGSRPSAQYVESVLREAGFDPQLQLDARLNSHFHTYDWSVSGTRTWRHGLRRFWFATAA